MTLPRFVSSVVFVALAAALLLNWQTILLSGSILLSDTRPALLADAKWNDPATARKFNSRFVTGTASAELVEWLRQNDFQVRADQGRAERKISSLPCNERVVVTWRSDSGRLAERRATVTESGCL